MILDLLYPKRCPLCLSVLPPGKKLICAPCVEKIRRVREPVCFCCGKPLRDETEEYCRDCRRNRPPFVRGIAWAEYSSEYMRRMISQVKYHGDCQILDYPCLDMAERYRERVLSWKAEALIPVPVHEMRRRERGYNQAEEIARRLSLVWKIRVDAGYLVRAEKTSAQKNLNSVDRMRNLMSAFRVRGEAGRYQRVIIVDDIYTTGSTVSACTRVLQAAGVAECYSAVLLIGRN